jgi:hypothetical protein
MDTNPQIPPYSLNDISGNTDFLPNHFSPADFGDAEDTRPASSVTEAFSGNGQAVRGIVGQTLARHLSELVPQQSPGMTGGSNQVNWRKRLRDMMIRQNETTLGFLQRPVGDHPMFGPVETAMRRFAIRGDVENRASAPLSTLLNTETIQQEIQTQIHERLSKDGPSSLTQLQAQNRALLELYKEIGEQLIETENQLKMRLEKMDKLQHRVASLMELQTNEALPRVVESMEEYLKIAFRDLQIEIYYNTLLKLYQKHAKLRESIKILQIGSPSGNSSDPLCGICLAEPVSYVHTPCGHTFCGVCSRRQGLTCYICRQNTRERVKVYFS